MTDAQGSLPEAFVAAFNARDGATMRALVTDDVEIRPLRAIVEDVVYRGADDIDRWVGDLAESWDFLRIDIEEVDDRHLDVQFVRGRVQASTHSGGPLTHATVYWIAWLRGDLLCKLVTLTDRERAEALFHEAVNASDALSAGLEEFQSIDVHDIAAWRALGETMWTDDIVMVEDPRWPGAGEFHGREEVAARFHEYFQSFEDGEAELLRQHGEGNERVLELLFRVRGKGSGASVEQRWAWHVRFRDGRLASIRPHLDVDEALASAGIAPS